MASGPVMLGYVHGGWVRAEFLNSVLNAVSGPEADPAIGGVISSSAGPLVALGRNLLVRQFLESNFEWLCSIDTDIVFTTDTVSNLLNSADPVYRPIVSALYYVFHQGKKVPAAYINLARGDKLNIHPVDDIGDEISTFSMRRVFSVGAGCLLVHRNVFEGIQKDAEGDTCWFREGVIDGQDFGEDVSFCIRATISGYPVHVNAAVRVGHIKSAMLGSVS